MEAEQIKEAVQNLKQILPHLESEGEAARRCFGVIVENFHVANRRLAIMEKKTEVPDESVIDFLVAAQEIRSDMERVLMTARLLEGATNEMARGAQDLARGHV